MTGKEKYWALSLVVPLLQDLYTVFGANFRTISTTLTWPQFQNLYFKRECFKGDFKRKVSRINCNTAQLLQIIFWR